MERVTLTVAETAKYLGVSDDTVYNMVRERQIPHIKVRRRILFRRETIDAWIYEQEKKYQTG